MRESRNQKLKKNYCIRMWLLQEVAFCTFLEARVYLHNERKESLEDIASAHGVSLTEVQTALNSAENKVRIAKENGDLFYGYNPIYPNDKDKIDW